MHLATNTGAISHHAKSPSTAVKTRKWNREAILIEVKCTKVRGDSMLSSERGEHVKQLQNTVAHTAWGKVR